MPLTPRASNCRIEARDVASGSATLRLMVTYLVPHSARAANERWNIRDDNIQCRQCTGITQCQPTAPFSTWLSHSGRHFILPGDEAWYCIVPSGVVSGMTVWQTDISTMNSCRSLAFSWPCCICWKAQRVYLAPFRKAPRVREKKHIVFALDDSANRIKVARKLPELEESYLNKHGFIWCSFRRIQNTTDAHLLKYHLISSQGPRFIRKDIFHLKTGENMLLTIVIHHFLRPRTPFSKYNKSPVRMLSPHL